MTPDQLSRGNKLKKRIDEMQLILNDSKEHTCERIFFSWGDGSNSTAKVVCNDTVTIGLIRRILVEQNEQLLKKLTDQFDNI